MLTTKTQQLHRVDFAFDQILKKIKSMFGPIKFKKKLKNSNFHFEGP